MVLNYGVPQRSWQRIIRLDLEQRGFFRMEQPGSWFQQTEEKRQETERRLRTIYEHSLDVIYTLDCDFRVTSISNSVERHLGYRAAELVGRPFQGINLLAPESLEAAFKDALHVLAGNTVTSAEYVFCRKDGSTGIGEVSGSPLVEDGNVIGLISIARDITERRETEKELRRNKDVAERLAQEMAIIAEIGKLVGSTLDTKEIYGRFAAEVRKLVPFDRLSVNLHDVDKGVLKPVYVSGEYIAGRQPGDVFPLKDSVSEVLIRTRAGIFSHPLSVEEMNKQFPHHVATIKAGMQSLLSVPLIYRDEVIASLHFRSRKPNVYTEQDLRLAERIGEQIAGAIVNAQLYAGLKKTEQELKESEQRYRELSIIDDLTQLYNSRHFYFQLKIELDRSNRYEQPLTLLLLDLDNFKLFNDAYGHIEGDQVLMRLGQVLKKCLRETDFAYRYGGEEFTILLPMTTRAEGAVTAERIRTEFKKETFSPASDQEVHVTASIGLAQYKSQEEMKVFVRRVDQLMYQGKKDGKDRVCCE